MSDDENRLRLTILGGFLGAGKSTWLRHQLFAKTYDQPYIIVNEVASHAVDDTLLVGANHLDVLAGGCVCCDLKDEMITLLHQICNDRSRRQGGPQVRQLVFEMSGVADPGQVIATIQNDPVLARHIMLEEIIVVVDALHGLEQLMSEALARQQIEAADRIIIAKTDSCEMSPLANLVATLRQINPASRFSGSVFGVEETLPDQPVVEPVVLPKIEGEERSEPISSLSLNLDDISSDEDIWVGFSIWLSAMLHSHGNRMVRVKGVVNTPSGRLLLQSVRKIMQAPERIPEQPEGANRASDNTIVLIGRGLEPERIKSSLRATIDMARS